MALAALVLLAAGCQGDADGVEPFGTIPCVPAGDVRFCEGGVDRAVASFDGVPLDVNVTLPSEGEGGFPLVVLLHGFGYHKLGLTEERGGAPSARSLAADGYAVLSYTTRGFHESCGSPASVARDPEGCAPVRDDARLGDGLAEVRDTQHLVGRLADQGLVEPDRIGVIGGSYGGAQAAVLATLRDRVRLPDGSYRPWRSPAEGLNMEIAAAVSLVSWSDLVYSLAPNGRTLDYVVDNPSDLHLPLGIPKQSLVAGYLAGGRGRAGPPAPVLGSLPPLARPIVAALLLGDRLAEGLGRELRERSPYHLRMDRPPAPILLSNGFTDDLFPVDEAIRFANRVRHLHPDAVVFELHFDYGHERSSNKEADLERLRTRTRQWLDRHLRGDAGAPALEGVEVMTQTCPASAPSGGPFRADSWPDLHPGEVRLRRSGPQTVASGAGNARVAARVDPSAPAAGPCVKTRARDEPGTATYRLRVRRPGGFTLAGSPTVISDQDVRAILPQATQIAARLWDVAPGGDSQRLVARGLYRPGGDGRRIFQLHPNAYHFDRGHTVKLELLGSDFPYGARSHPPPFRIEISTLDLRLPVLEEPGPGPIDPPAAPSVPPGATPAPGYRGAAR